jgi:hypothetical protein
MNSMQAKAHVVNETFLSIPCVDGDEVPTLHASCFRLHFPFS